MKCHGALKNIMVSNIAVAEMHRMGIYANFVLIIPVDAASEMAAPRVFFHGGQLLISCCGIDMVSR